MKRTVSPVLFVALLFILPLSSDAISPSMVTSTPTPTVHPVSPTLDLRTMVRTDLIQRCVAALDSAEFRRQHAFTTGDWQPWRQRIRNTVREQLGPLPTGPDAPPLNIRLVSRQTFQYGTLENVLFESYPGWDVNASVFLPDPDVYAPPWNAVVIPVGHSAKVRTHYQIPAQAFASFGYVAVLFDPPGMAGEKQGGNDHFIDGVRTYLTGHSSNRYFVADAIRCIDYLETRQDVDTRAGVGMTGVSGGGATTMVATLLDDRIRAAGPACCAVPTAQHPIRDAYSPCVEPLAYNRIGAGIDNVDLLCATVPTPLLYMYGEQDEVFHVEWSRDIVRNTQNAFAQAGSAESFSFYKDPGGHDYTLEMTRRFTEWMDRWIKQQKIDRPTLSEDQFEMLPDSMLFCYPDRSVNMYTLNAEIAQQLAESRSTPDLATLSKLCNLESISASPPASKSHPPFQVWVHDLIEVALYPESGIECPATLMLPRDSDERCGAVLFFDDRGRWSELRQQGRLAQMIRFLDRSQPGFACLTVDLRGWGDTTPADAPYEIPVWGHRERWISYVSAALGDPILSGRIRDACAAYHYLQNRPEIDLTRIVVAGQGMGAVVAMHLAALMPRAAGVVAIQPPASFKQLATAPDYSWSPEAFWPEVLKYYDLPDLVEYIQCPLFMVQPLDALKQPISREQIRKLYKELPDDHIQTEPDNDRMVSFVQSIWQK